MNTTRFLVQRYRWAFLSVLAAFIATSCAINPETQAKMDEYARTIPTCMNDTECDRMWAWARTWTLQNSDFSIRGESDTRISASSNLISQSGTGVTVNKVANGSAGSQLVVDLECFSAYSCPDIWDLKVDFNKTISGISE